MSKSFRSERFIPISASRRSLLNPSWEVEPWDLREDYPLSSYNSYRAPISHSRPMRMLDHQFNDLQNEMEQRMAAMRSQMFTLLPSESYLKPIEGNYAGSSFPRLDTPNMIEKDGKSVMELRFDVQQFKPEDINIKTKDNVLEVHAKHEDNNENAKVLREYKRQITLPVGTVLEDMSSILSPEGILTVEAPIPKKAIEAPAAPIKAQSLQIKHE